MKAILKGLIATGSIAVPAATTVGLVYGIKKEDTKLYFSPADTTGDKFFDSTIAPTSSNFASKMIINPPNGSPLNELVRLDQDLDYDRLLPLLKKDTITKKIKAPIKTWKVGFSLDKTVEQTNNKFKEINKWISKNILNKHEYHDDGEFIAGTDKKVRKSVGSSRVGIDIRKDLIKREVLVTLYDLVAEDAQTKNIADMFMKDIGGIDLSKIHFDPTNPEGFYEIFAGKLHLSYRYLNKYFKFKNVPPFYRQDLNGKLLPSYEISKFETKWGLNMSRVISNHYLGQKSYPGEEYEFAIFNSAKTPSTDAKVDEMISKFPKVSKKYAHGNPLRKDIKRRINFEHGIRVKNPKYSFESAFKFINPKTKAPITWDIKPIYDVNTGEIKLIFSFMELYKKLDSKGNIIESSSVEEDSTWEVKNYSNISRRIVSFNIKEIIKDKTHDKVPNKDTQTAVKILRDCLRGKFKEFVYNNLVNAGVKLMETLTPVLGTAMSDFEQIIKTLNSMKKSDDILTDEFVKSLLTQMEKDPFVDVNLFVKLMKEFDLKKWTSMEFLTNLDPHNGGQFNLFLLTTGWHSISDLILQEMKKKVPGIMIQYNGPIIKDLLKELKNLNLMGKSSGINDILKDPLDFGKKLLTKLVNKKVVLPETLLEKLIPMIPLKIIQKNAPKIQKALRIIIGDGSNLNKILSEIIESNKSLMDKLYKEWINEPGTSGRTKSDIDSNKKNELLLGWLLSPKAISIPLSSLTDENIVTVLVTTKFSADTFMVLGKAILASGIAPSFLNMIIPDTYPKAKEFSKLFTSGTAEEIFRAFQDVYINGLDKLTEPGAYHTDSEFVKKTKVLIHHILTEIKLDNLVTGLPSGIGHAVEPIISDTILPLIEKLLRTPIVQWPALFAPGTELAGVLDTLDLVLPKNIGDMISKFRKIIPVVGDLLNKGLKETIKPKNGGIDRLIDSFAMVADISKYKDLINGLLHGFHDYSTLKAVFDDVSPSIISTSLSAAGELGPDLLAHMVDGTSLGFLLGVAKGSIFHGTEYVVLSKLLKTGILSLSNSQLNVVTKMLSEFADRSIPIVGKLGELLPLKPEQLTLLKTLTVKKTGKLLSELLSKPIKDLTIESWKELLRIAASVTGINIPKNTGEAISKLLTHSITSFNPHNLRLILHSVISLTGLSSSEEVITKWALKILVGDYTLSHEKQFQDEKLLSEKQRFHTFDILPNKKSFSGSLPLGLVDEEATKNQINVLISRIEKMTDLDERGQEIARLTQKINKLKELKDAIVSANTEGDLLKAKLKNIQLMSTSINLPVVTPFKYANTMEKGTSPQEIIDAFNIAKTFVPLMTSTFAEVNAQLEAMTDVVEKVNAANAKVVYINSKYISDDIWKILTSQTGAFTDKNYKIFTSWDAATKTLKIRLIGKDGGFFSSDYYRVDTNAEGEWIPDGPLILMLDGKKVHVAMLDDKVIFYFHNQKPKGAIDILIKDMDHEGDHNWKAAFSITFKDTEIREQASVIWHYDKLDPDHAAKQVEKARLAKILSDKKSELITKVSALADKDFINHDWELYNLMLQAKDTAIIEINAMTDPTVVPASVEAFKTAKITYSNSLVSTKPLPLAGISDKIWNALVGGGSTIPITWNPETHTMVIKDMIKVSWNKYFVSSGNRNPSHIGDKFTILGADGLKIEIGIKEGKLVFYEHGHANGAVPLKYKGIYKWTPGKPIITAKFNANKEVISFTLASSGNFIGT